MSTARLERTLANDQEHRDHRQEQQDSATEEHEAQPERRAGDASDHRPDRAPQRNRRGHHAERPAHAVAWRLDRHQRGGRRDGSAGRALQQAQHDQLDRRLHEEDEADRDGAAEHRADEHRLASEAIAQHTPDRTRDRHRQARNASGCRGPEVEVAAGCNAEVLRDEDGQEWKREAETEDGRELREPQRDEVSSPVDSSRAQRWICTSRISAQRCGARRWAWVGRCIQARGLE